MNIGYWIIDIELGQMSKYLDLVELALEQQFKELEVSFQKDIAREMTEDEAGFLSDDYTDAFIDLGQDFPQLLLLSFIVMWYSFVEQELLDFCEQLKLSISIGPKDNEYFDKGIRRARKFLLKAKNYEIDSNHWQELIKIGKLRNIIVHEGKRLSCSYFEPDGKFVSCTPDGGGTDVYIAVEKDLFQYLQKHNLIEVTGPPFVDIRPSFDYCRGLLKFGNELFRKLYSDLMPKQRAGQPGRA